MLVTTTGSTYLSIRHIDRVCLLLSCDPPAFACRYNYAAYRPRVIFDSDHLWIEGEMWLKSSQIHHLYVLWGSKIALPAFPIALLLVILYLIDQTVHQLELHRQTQHSQGCWKVMII